MKRFFESQHRSIALPVRSECKRSCFKRQADRSVAASTDRTAGFEKRFLQNEGCIGKDGVWTL